MIGATSVTSRPLVYHSVLYVKEILTGGASSETSDDIFKTQVYCFFTSLNRRRQEPAALLSVSPAVRDAEVTITRMSFHQQIIDFPDLRGLPFILRHPSNLIRSVKRGTRVIRPIKIIEDQPSSYAEQSIDEEESKAIDKPIMRAINITEVKSRRWIFFEKLH
jgi:hypothetical protein